MSNIYSVARKVKDSMDITLKPLNFVEIEILFRLCERLEIKYKVKSFYRLLSGSHIIINEKFNSNDFLKSNARILLKTLNHSKVYKDVLQEYCLQNNREYAYYVIENDELKRNENPPRIYANRIIEYDMLLDEAVADRPKKVDFARDQRETYAAYVNDSKMLDFKYKKLDYGIPENKQRSKSSDKIVISLNNILESAEKIDKAEKNNYRRNVLEKNIFSTKDGIKNAVDYIEIDGVINIAGQVASGKTTFAEALAVAMMDKNYRIVIIQPTVSDILKKAEMFKLMGYRVSVLTGNEGRCKHIDNLMKDKDFLSEYKSEILQSPCILNALLNESEEVFKYGKEPCHRVYKYKYGKINLSKILTCGYYNMCTKTVKERKINCADVVITTLEGYCMMSFGPEKTNFMTYALDNFDLVIMDEVDNLLCKLDNIFSPILAVNEYLNKNLPFRIDYKRKSLIEKLKTDANQREILIKLDRFERMMVDISQEIINSDTGWNTATLKNFTALLLLNKLQRNEETDGLRNDKERLPDQIWHEIYGLMKPTLSDEQTELLNLIKGGECSVYIILQRLVKICEKENGVEEDYIWEKCNRLSAKTLKRLLFILKIVGFEQEYRDLSKIVENSIEIPMEVRDILSRNLKIQQRIMPNAPIGNTLAIEVKEKDMYIKKQFAFGRALALKMPALRLDQHGKPIGSNVLLMSGTGYMPGSMSYHVSDKVDYIIEAEEHKRDYISKTKIVNTHSDTYVSGADPKIKNSQLKKLIKENEKTIIGCIKNDETILMIVNSYEQVLVVTKFIESVLIKNKINVSVSALQPDGSEKISDDTTMRSELIKFDKKILVAPACVIERGYNIVDELGNAKFDTVMFLVRPLTDPDDYLIHVQKVNGYIMNKYSGIDYSDEIDIMEKMRSDAFEMYYRLSKSKGRIKDLPEEFQTDIIASLFVIIEQVFGRLCRIGLSKKGKYPTVYFMDGAFNGKGEDDFDTLGRLEKYLYEIINSSSNKVAAKTLYEPFYKALKGDRSDEQ